MSDIKYFMSNSGVIWSYNVEKNYSPVSSKVKSKRGWIEYKKRSKDHESTEVSFKLWDSISELAMIGKREGPYVPRSQAGDVDSPLEKSVSAVLDKFDLYLGSTKPGQRRSTSESDLFKSVCEAIDAAHADTTSDYSKDFLSLISDTLENFHEEYRAAKSSD